MLKLASFSERDLQSVVEQRRGRVVRLRRRQQEAEAQLLPEQPRAALGRMLSVRVHFLEIVDFIKSNAPNTHHDGTFIELMS